MNLIFSKLTILLKPSKHLKKFETAVSFPKNLFQNIQIQSQEKFNYCFDGSLIL